MSPRAALAIGLLLLSAPPSWSQADGGTATPPAAASPAAPEAPQAPVTSPPPPIAAPAAPDAPAAGAPAPEAGQAQAAPLEVHYGEEGLPEKVRLMRSRILEATRTGDLEALRPVIESNEVPPALSGGDSDDAIATLKLLSGDEKGREILAILQEVLESGYVHADVGTPQEMYIWPYFTRVPLDKLTGRQLVELFRLITAGDLQDMQDKGVYSFYRVGIGPDGTWHYFEDGD
jgi:nucleoid-associated protein YgaU